MKHLITLILALTTLTLSAQERINLTLNETAKGDYYPEKRFALIIDNTGSAKALNDSLNNLGFDVLLCENAGTVLMKSAADTYVMMATDYDVILSYFKGNSCERDQQMYLLPTDISDDNADVKKKSIDVSKFLEAVAKTGRQKTIAIFESDNIKNISAPENITLHYSIKEDCLGSLAEDLYAKAKQEEKEAADAVAAIAALEETPVTVVKETTKPMTAEEYYKKGMSRADKNSGTYDIEEAITNLKIAASKGHTDAMYQLALIYEKKDQMQSMLWMGRASSAGHQKAKEYVKARKKKPVGHDIIK